jgi:hypothetical protein
MTNSQAKEPGSDASLENWATIPTKQGESRIFQVKQQGVKRRSDTRLFAPVFYGRRNSFIEGGQERWN